MVSPELTVTGDTKEAVAQMIPVVPSLVWSVVTKIPWITFVVPFENVNVTLPVPSAPRTSPEEAGHCATSSHGKWARPRSTETAARACSP